jgi:hypothetical protein
MKPLLIFHLDTAKSEDLIEGRLLLINKDNDQIIERYRATSGCPSNQTYLHISAKGRGPIPPQYETKIQQYQVMTTPIFMPETKGVQGNFFKINPYTVQVGEIERGDFGVHADKNVPGSAGCVVLTSDAGWTDFQVQMRKLAAIGINQAPLLISYVR